MGGFAQQPPSSPSNSLPLVPSPVLPVVLDIELTQQGLPYTGPIINDEDFGIEIFASDEDMPERRSDDSGDDGGDDDSGDDSGDESEEI